jgi:amino acid transporter
VALLNDASVPVHILGVVILVGALLIFAPKQPLHFLWQASSSSGVHASYWWLFLLGLLQAQWTYTGFDASAHVAEETVDPRWRAPWAMVMAVGVSGVFGYILILSLTLAIRNINQVLAAKDAGGNSYPAVLAISQAALGTRAVFAVLGVTILAMWFCGLAACTSLSRTIYAFGRDRGLPFSDLWSGISPKHTTPVAALWLGAGMAFAAMVYSGAYSVVTSISVIGFYLSYGIPIYLALKTKAAWADSRGPWHLGRFSRAIGLLALLWTIFICTIMVMPPNARAGWGITIVIVPLFLLHLLRGKYGGYGNTRDHGSQSGTSEKTGA